MSVAVAHQESATARLILQEAANEASLRQTSMSVIHIAEGVDVDLIEEQKVNLRAQTVLDLVADTDVELLVIGARHRSAVGKLIMGSVTQTIILRAEVPVLVVKAPVRT